MTTTSTIETVEEYVSKGSETAEDSEFLVPTTSETAKVAEPTGINAPICFFEKDVPQVAESDPAQNTIEKISGNLHTITTEKIEALEPSGINAPICFQEKEVPQATESIPAPSIEILEKEDTQPDERIPVPTETDEVAKEVAEPVLQSTEA